MHILVLFGKNVYVLKNRLSATSHYRIQMLIWCNSCNMNVYNNYLDGSEWEGKTTQRNTFAYSWTSSSKGVGRVWG